MIIIKIEGKKQKLILILFSELLCLFVTRIFLLKYNNPIYLLAMNYLQTLYFLPILIVTPIILFDSNPNETSFIYTTLGLILYSIFLRLEIVPIISLFTDTQGIINFAEYAFKIYFIALPLLGIIIKQIKKESIKKLYFLFLIKIILLTVITFLFNFWFGLNGVLYAAPVSELVYFLKTIKK